MKRINFRSEVYVSGRKGTPTETVPCEKVVVIAVAKVAKVAVDEEEKERKRDEAKEGATVGDL